MELQKKLLLDEDFRENFLKGIKFKDFNKESFDENILEEIGLEVY